MIPCDFTTSSNYTVFTKKVLAASIAYCSFTTLWEISRIPFCKAQNNLHFKSSVEMWIPSAVQHPRQRCRKVQCSPILHGETLHWYYVVKSLFILLWVYWRTTTRHLQSLSHPNKQAPTRRPLPTPWCLTIIHHWQIVFNQTHALFILSECHSALSPSSLTFKSSADLISENMLSAFAPRRLRSLILKNKHKQIIWSLPEPLR